MIFSPVGVGYQQIKSANLLGSVPVYHAGTVCQLFILIFFYSLGSVSVSALSDHPAGIPSVVCTLTAWGVGVVGVVWYLSDWYLSDWYLSDWYLFVWYLFVWYLFVWSGTGTTCQSSLGSMV